MFIAILLYNLYLFIINPVINIIKNDKIALQYIRKKIINKLFFRLLLKINSVIACCLLLYQYRLMNLSFSIPSLENICIVFDVNLQYNFLYTAVKYSIIRFLIHVFKKFKKP